MKRSDRDKVGGYFLAATSSMKSIIGIMNGGIAFFYLNQPIKNVVGKTCVRVILGQPAINIIEGTLSLMETVERALNPFQLNCSIQRVKGVAPFPVPNQLT